MIELARHEGAGLILLRRIAAAESIPRKYLEQLTIPLQRAGLVLAERGPRGGYELARPSDQITAREIIEAIEGPLSLVDCVREPSACDRAPICAARRLWGKVSEAIADVLSRTTLAELREQQRAAEEYKVASYRI
jgi:Rrf2 family protein